MHVIAPCRIVFRGRARGRSSEATQTPPSDSFRNRRFGSRCLLPRASVCSPLVRSTGPWRRSPGHPNAVPHCRAQRQIQPLSAPVTSASTLAPQQQTRSRIQIPNMERALMREQASSRSNAVRRCSSLRILAALTTLMLLATLAAFSSLSASAAPFQSLESDCAPTPLPAVVRIAILVYCSDRAVGALSGHPFDSCGPEPSVNSKKFITQSLQGLQMYTDLMRDQQANILPLPSGANVTLQFTYINQGRVNFDDPAEFEALLPSLTGPDGLWASVTNATRAEAEYGGAFTFIVTSMSTPDTAQPLLLNQCEETNECIVILPYHLSNEVTTCTAIDPDCVRRGRLPGTRRFSNTLTVLALSPNYAGAALELLKVQGVRTLAVVSQARGGHGSTFIHELLVRSPVLAAQLNIRTVFSMEMVLCGDLCGPTETHVFPNRTAEETAREIAAANPDALILWATTDAPYSFASFDAMFEAFARIDWTPRALLIMPSAHASISKYLSDPSRIAYSIVSVIFDPRFKGPQFRNYKTASSFELLPATDLKDAPQVYAEAFHRKFAGMSEEYSSVGGGTGGYIPVLGFHALIIAQKLIEFAETAHVSSLLLAATRISAPSAFRPIEFDVLGSLRVQDWFMMQLTPMSANATKEKPFDYSILTPYNVGVPPVFPLPTWKERVYEPAFYSTPAELAIVALSVVLLLGCAILLALIGVWWQHPVIAASTPVFCCLVVVGCMLMLTSNFFSTLHVTDAHCKAQVWLLTLGFSLTFGALFIKTYRVHTLLSSKHLAAVSLPQRDLLLATLAILSVDAILNIAWKATVGLRSQLIVVDPIRPFYNYTQCAYGDGQLGFVFAHIAIKCTLLLCGVILAWKVRRAPSLFSESTHISVCIYNVSVVLTFLLPVLATGLGGRSALYLIRALSICFVATTTCIVLFAPKFWTISKLRPAPTARSDHEYDLKTDATRTGAAAAAKSLALPDAALTNFQQPPPSDIFSLKRDGLASPVMSGPAPAADFDAIDIARSQPAEQQQQPADLHQSTSGLTSRRVPHSARFAPWSAATTAKANTPAEHTGSTELTTLRPAQPPAAAAASSRHRLPAGPSGAAAAAFPLVPASTAASPFTFTANRAIRIHMSHGEDELVEDRLR